MIKQSNWMTSNKRGDKFASHATRISYCHFIWASYYKTKHRSYQQIYGHPNSQWYMHAPPTSSPRVTKIQIKIWWGWSMEYLCFSSGSWLLLLLMKRKSPSSPPMMIPWAHRDRHHLWFFCFFHLETDGWMDGLHPWIAYLDNLAGLTIDHCSKQFFDNNQWRLLTAMR